MTIDSTTADGGRTVPPAYDDRTPRMADGDSTVRTTPPAPSPNPSPWRRRGLALAAIIVGGLLALALAFGGGIALGWALGVAGSSISGDRPGQGDFRGGPGDGGRNGQLPPGQDDSTDEGSDDTTS